MFNSKPIDPLDELLCDAQALVSERTRLLETIRKTEGNLAECEQELTTALGKERAEEFEAAQREGGLAVASKAAKQAVSEANLKLKSVRLRLQGLQVQRESMNARVVAAWDGLRVYRDEQIRQKIADVRAEFDTLIEPVLRALWKVHALAKFASESRGEVYNFHPAGIEAICLFNPLGTGKGLAIGQGMFSNLEGQKGFIGSHWQDDAEALGLCEAIRVINESIAPVEAVVGEIRPSKK